MTTLRTMNRLFAILLFFGCVGAGHATGSEAWHARDHTPAIRHTHDNPARGDVIAVSPTSFQIVPAPRLPGHRNQILVSFQPSLDLRPSQPLLLTFRARAAAAVDSGQAGMVLELSRSAAADGPRPEAFFRHIVIVGNAWENFALPVEIPEPLRAGSWTLLLTPSYFDQSVEIADLAATYAPPETALSAPEMYAGQAADAPWRAEAAARIQRHRQSELRIVVTDALGQPVPNATVRIRQTRHAYRFGTAVVAGRLVDAPWEFGPDSGMTTEQFRADNARYRAEFLRLFNTAVFENDLKWPMWADGGRPPYHRYRQEWTLGALTWLRAQEIVIKGHTMIWPSWERSPDWLKALADRPELLQSTILRHITDVGAATAPFTAYWDVVNEPMSHRDILELLGTDAAGEWFKAARKVLPSTRLVMNEFDLVGNGGSPGRRANFAALVNELRARGAPLDVVGFQGHFWSDRLTPPAQIWQILDEVHAATGLPAMVSEFDLNFPNDRLQADYTRDFLTAWFAHPATEAFIMWGFWGRAHWMGERGAMFRNDWTPKPNLAAYEQLVLREWWTDTSAQTDARGEASVRAFHGRHRVEVSLPDAAPRVREVELPAGGTQVDVVLGFTAPPSQRD